MPAVETKVRTKVDIEIPQSAYDAYERLSKVEKKSIALVFSDRLEDCVSHNAQKGIWLGDAERQQCEEALAVNVNNAGELVSAVKSTTEIRVSDIAITVPPMTLDRLKSRCFEDDFAKWLTDLVLEGLDRYTNMA